MAGYNLYEFDGAGGLLKVEAQVFEPATESFRVDTIQNWD